MRKIPVKYVATAFWVGLAIAQCGCTKPPDVSQIDTAGLETVLEEHRGKVVLVDFWATWCSPCVESFPHTVQLHRRWGDEGLVVITVNLDPPEKRARAIAFLRDQGARTQNLFSRWGDGPASFEAFDLEGIPTVRIYGRDGNLLRNIIGASPQAVDQAVEEALQ